MTANDAAPGAVIPDRPHVAIRNVRPEDHDAVVEIDALHEGREKPDYWREMLARFSGPAGTSSRRIALAAEIDGALVGHLFGEIRSFEFGTDECGWVLGLGVRSDRRRAGIASLLLEHAVERFRGAGVRRVRTLVRRDDVPMLSLFRTADFVGGGFVQLELDVQEES